MVFDVILQIIAQLFLLFLALIIFYCIYKATIGLSIDIHRRSKASDISDFLDNEFKRLYYYEFGRPCHSRWQICVWQNDGSWDFCNYFEYAYENLIEEYKRLTNNEDRL